VVLVLDNAVQLDC